MKAVIFNNNLYVDNAHKPPEIQKDWAIINVNKAGICKTDLELTKGYMGFKGILGHEFIGTIKNCHDDRMIGKRVAGEINVSCGHCEMCKKNLERHCYKRKVLGIQGLNGCMAEYCSLPLANLIEIPSEINDDRAIFIEPLSAACEILEQVKLSGEERVIVLGDGNLGILCSWVLSTVCSNITLLGHHRSKLDLSKWNNLKITNNVDDIKPGADIVIDATGSKTGLSVAISLCRPRGIVVLKTTISQDHSLNLASLVIQELNIIGSRCGQFKDGIKMLLNNPDMPLERLISCKYPLEKATEAFKVAKSSESIKVILENIC